MSIQMICSIPEIVKLSVCLFKIFCAGAHIQGLWQPTAKPMQFLFFQVVGCFLINLNQITVCYRSLFHCLHSFSIYLRVANVLGFFLLSTFS